VVRREARDASPVLGRPPPEQPRVFDLEAAGTGFHRARGGGARGLHADANPHRAPASRARPLAVRRNPAGHHGLIRSRETMPWSSAAIQAEGRAETQAHVKATRPSGRGGSPGSRHEQACSSDGQAPPFVRAPGDRSPGLAGRQARRGPRIGRLRLGALEVLARREGRMVFLGRAPAPLEAMARGHAGASGMSHSRSVSSRARGRSRRRGRRLQERWRLRGKELAVGEAGRLLHAVRDALSERIRLEEDPGSPRGSEAARRGLGRCLPEVRWQARSPPEDLRGGWSCFWIQLPQHAERIGLQSFRTIRGTS